MRVLSTLFWALVALVLVVLGLANRSMVELRLLPVELEARLGHLPDLELPLFLVIVGGVALGMALGFVWEWIREIPERAEARRLARELAALRAEVGRQKAEGARGDLVAALDLPPVPAVPRR